MFSDPATKPATVYPACATYCGSWVASDGACSNSCGAGSFTRNYICSTGTDSQCNPGTKPAAISVGCATYCGSWLPSDSACSNSCGTGSITRSYVCSTGNSANW